MTDRELLELAAKAVGYAVCEPFRDGEFRVCGHDRLSFVWNPLDDDGDALRLATRLLIDIGHNHPAEQQRYVVADRRGCEGVFSPISCMEDEFEERDRAAATRRAIVRAAAAIGEAMP